MKRFQKVLLWCCVPALAAVLLLCLRPDKAAEPQGKAYFSYFDTVSYVYSYAGDPAEQFALRADGVSAILSDYHQLFDIYHEYSGINNLCTVNRLAGGEPVRVDERLILFLQEAVEMYDRTEGEMNVLMGAVLRLWHDCRTAAEEDPAKAVLPDPEALREASLHTDISLLEIDAEACTVRLTDPMASIDVGALGKGYAAERAADYLEGEQAFGYVLNIGGNLRMIGEKPGSGSWVTGIRNPADPDGDFARRLKLQDTSCVTSGSYERFFTVDGKRYPHIIDRDTLYPAEYFTSITVIVPDSALADALSTALFCVPYEKGLELIGQFDGAEALWIFPDGEQRWTPGLERAFVS